MNQNMASMITRRVNQPTDVVKGMGVAGDQGPQASAAAKLQHATQVLQAALANWEACLQNEESTKKAQTMAEPMRLAPAQVPTGPPGIPALDVLPFMPCMNSNFQAPGLSHVPPESAASGFLEKAFGGLLAGGAPEFMAGKGMGRSSANEKEMSMCLLQHYLERQQEANASRLAKLMQDNFAGGFSHTSLAAQWAATYGGLGAAAAWPPMPLFQGGAAPAPTGLSQAWAKAEARCIPKESPSESPAYVPLLGALAGAQMPKFSKWSAAMSGVAGTGNKAVTPQTLNLSAAVAANGAKTGKGAGKQKRTPVVEVERALSPRTGVPNGCETLRMHLRSLLKIESNRVLIVRKINRLGFASPQVLHDHYSWHGTVEKVLVAHSRVKSGSGPQNGSHPSRLRPSGLGFMVMSRKEECEAILHAGQEQLVSGAMIRVQQFERRMSEDAMIAAAADGEEDQEEDEQDTVAVSDQSERSQKEEGTFECA